VKKKKKKKDNKASTTGNISVELCETNSTHHMRLDANKKKIPRCPVLVVVSGNLLDVGRILPIGRETCSVGRDSSTDLALNDRLVSRKHFEVIDLKQEDSDFSILVRDNNSTNGTFLKAKKITETWVKQGETIEIGSETILLFRTEIFTRIQESDLTLCMVSKDPLTEIYNRRAFEQLLEHTHERAVDSCDNYCLLLIDIDNFKEVNDSLGHPVGDKVLKALAILIRNEIRAEEFVARIGGDEFAVLMPYSDSAAGINLAKRLVSSIKNMKNESNESMNITLSIGIAEGTNKSHKINHTYENADRALYFSKNMGRNQYTVYDESMKRNSENRMS